MRKIFLLSAIFIFASAAQAQRAGMAPSTPSSAPPTDRGRQGYYTNCFYDDDDYLIVPLEIDPDAPSAQYRPAPATAATARASAPAGGTGGYNPSSYANSNQSGNGQRRQASSGYLTLPVPVTTTSSLGDVARAYRSEKAAAPKAKIAAEQDNNGKIILVPQNP